MNEVQTTLLGMYRDVKAILDGEGIPYYVQFGTSLGAVRHDGFIPWDDDIDIIAWDADMPRINRVLSERLDPGKYFYHIPSADSHPHVIFKGDDIEEGLREKKAPFIDIFPIERYPSTKLRQLFYGFFTWGNLGFISLINHVGPVCVHKCLTWIPHMFAKLARMTVDDGTTLTTVVCTRFKKYIFDESWFDEPIIHKFEDTVVPIPRETDRMLTQMFGDYMTPPPEDQRGGAGGFPCSSYKDYLIANGGKKA